MSISRLVEFQLEDKTVNMTAVFRSCAPRIFSKNDHLSERSPSIHDDTLGVHFTPPLDAPFEQKEKTSKKQAMKIARKRGPRFTRIQANPTPLLTRLVGTIFGDQPFSRHCVAKQSPSPPKDAILPSAATLKTQFEDNEKTLRSLVTLLNQLESKAPLTTTSDNQNSSEQARNNNRMDDTSVGAGTIRPRPRSDRLGVRLTRMKAAIISERQKTH